MVKRIFFFFIFELKFYWRFSGSPFMIVETLESKKNCRKIKIHLEVTCTNCQKSISNSVVVITLAKWGQAYTYVGVKLYVADVKKKIYKLCCQFSFVKKSENGYCDTCKRVFSDLIYQKGPRSS